MEFEASKRKYKKILYEERIRLIELVCQHNLPCATAAKKLDLSPSTAKMIVKNYKENGKIFEKKEDRIKRCLLLEFEGKQEKFNSISPSISPAQEFVPFYFYVPNMSNYEMVFQFENPYGMPFSF